MKLYVLKYKNYYLRYVFDEIRQEEYILKEDEICYGTLHASLKTITIALNEIKEGNIRLFARKDEIEEIKNKTYIMELELKEIGEINNG